MSLSECKTMGGNEHENVWTFIEKYSSNAYDTGNDNPLSIGWVTDCEMY